MTIMTTKTEKDFTHCKTCGCLLTLENTSKAFKSLLTGFSCKHCVNMDMRMKKNGHPYKRLSKKDAKYYLRQIVKANPGITGEKALQVLLSRKLVYKKARFSASGISKKMSQDWELYRDSDGFYLTGELNLPEGIDLIDPAYIKFR